MNKRTLETVLLDQKNELKNWKNEAFCARYEEGLLDLSSPQAQVVIGVRRSGKSTLCLQALAKSGVEFAYVDFDDERLAEVGTAGLNDVLEVLYKIYGDFHYVFFDEIQNIEGWPLFVNRLLRSMMHVVLTGSNAKLLSNDLATHLTGRSSETSLYPFSFSEFCALRNIDTTLRTTKGTALLRKTFDDYMQQGGFPELMQVSSAGRYVSNLVENILHRDIEQRYNIAYPAQFENLAHHLLNISPCIISTTELAETFGFGSIHTVRNYIDYLKQAYVLVGVKKFSPKSRVRIVNDKIYAVDVAMMNRRENAFAGENLGWRLETIVLIQLMRRAKCENLDVYYLAERSGECDFVLCDGNRVVQCIQVSYDISSPKTRKRELAGLMLAHHKTGCNNLLLLTDHDYEDLSVNGLSILIRPVYEWSLSE